MCGAQMLATLPPALLAEAQALRERSHRMHRNMMGERRPAPRPLATGAGGAAGPFPVPSQRQLDAHGRHLTREAWLLQGGTDMPLGSGPQSAVGPEVYGHPQVGRQCQHVCCYAVGQKATLQLQMLACQGQQL